ncbi:MAG: polysaccharide biosynthesis protein [Bryobacteraceae bacterium]
MKRWDTWEADDLPPGLARETAGLAILVTGAGGYIGSALAGAIAAAGPACLVLLDSSEQNLFGVDRRLSARANQFPRKAILGSVTDAALLDRVFSRFHPQVVCHAAALKHVPLLEWNPLAAVRENAIGTYTLARAAAEHGVEALVLVSTDKAVNPRSIMGASKRLAELIVVTLSGAVWRPARPPQATSLPHMNAVRLGNVIGSTGSVIPIFREQIRRGGPVTVTHPDASRYFMTSSEAVGAILAAGSADCSGRILLPELGEPERIADLAQRLIGETQIPIQFIGLRPGEKLHEDLLYSDEVREGRMAGGLHVIRTPSPTPSELHAAMAEIACLLSRGDLARTLEAMRALVPEYAPSSAILAAAARSAG